MSVQFYSDREMSDWARYYQRASRQYRECGLFLDSAILADRGRKFLFAIIDGRKIIKY